MDILVDLLLCISIIGLAYCIILITRQICKLEEKLKINEGVK